MAVTWGFLVLLALFFVDLKAPSISNWTDYARIYHPVGEMVSRGQMADIYSLAAAAPEKVNIFSQVLAGFSPAVAEFRDMPLCAWVLEPLALLDLSISQVIWHIASLLALAYSTYLISRSAAVVDLDSDDASDVGWACLSFAPVLLTLWEGQLGLVFGLLPLAAGYYLMTKKKAGLAGLVWSLTLLKPAFFIVALTNALAATLAKKRASLIGLIAGVALLLGFTAILSPAALSNWFSVLGTVGAQPQMNPRLDISLSHAILAFVPAEQHGALQPVILFVGGMIAVGTFMQLLKVIEAEDKEEFVLPCSTMVGAMLAPILLPHLPFYDLSVLTIGALVVFCMDWREHLQWRVHSLTRLNWLCINAYVVLFYLSPAAAHPIELIALMLIFHVRLVETVRFIAHAPSN